MVGNANTPCRFWPCQRRDCYFQHKQGQQAFSQQSSPSSHDSSRYEKYQRPTEPRHSRSGSVAHHGYRQPSPSPARHGRERHDSAYGSGGSVSAASTKDSAAEWGLNGFDFHSGENPIDRLRYRPMLLHPAYVDEGEKKNSRLKFEINLVVLFQIIRHLRDFVRYDHFWEGVCQIRGDPWGPANTREVFNAYRTARLAYRRANDEERAPTLLARMMDVCITIMDQPVPDSANITPGSFQDKIREWASKEKSFLSSVKTSLTNKTSPSSNHHSTDVNSPAAPLAPRAHSFAARVSSVAMPRTEDRHDSKVEPSSSLYLNPIPVGTKSHAIEGIFKAYGEVSSIRILTPRRCAFVNFAKMSQAVDAMNSLNGREIIPFNGPTTIKFAKPFGPNVDDTTVDTASRSHSPSITKESTPRKDSLLPTALANATSAERPSSGGSAVPLDVLIEQEARKSVQLNRSPTPNGTSSLSRKRSGSEEVDNTPAKRRATVSFASPQQLATPPRSGSITEGSGAPKPVLQQALDSIPEVAVDQTPTPNSNPDVAAPSREADSESDRFVCNPFGISKVPQLDTATVDSSSATSTANTNLKTQETPNRGPSEDVSPRTATADTAMPDAPSVANTLTQSSVEEGEIESNASATNGTPERPSNADKSNEPVTTNKDAAATNLEISRLKAKVAGQGNTIKELRQKLETQQQSGDWRAGDRNMREREASVYKQEEGLKTREESLKTREEKFRGRLDLFKGREDKLRAREASVRDNEGSLESRKKAVQDREDVVRDREDAFRDRRAALQKREDALHDREVALQEREKSQQAAEKSDSTGNNQQQKSTESTINDALLERLVQLERNQQKQMESMQQQLLERRESAAMPSHDNALVLANQHLEHQLSMAPSESREAHLAYLEPRDAKTALDGVGDELRAIHAILHLKMKQQDPDAPQGWTKMQYISEVRAAIDRAVKAAEKGVMAL